MLVSLLTHICIIRPQWVQCPTLNKELLYRKYMRFISQLYILFYILCLNQSVHLRNRTVTFSDIWILHRRHMGVSNHWLRNSTVCSTDCWGKYQRPRSCPFVRGIYRWPMVPPHKKPVTQPPFLALCEDNPSMTDGFPSQKASNAENISISWCYQDIFHWSTHSSMHPFKAHPIIKKANKSITMLYS